jgi:hypothetical protein
MEYHMTFIAAILFPPILLNMYWSHREMYNFGYYSTLEKPSSTWLIVVFFVQIGLELIGNLIVTVVEEKRKRGLIHSWLPSTRRKAIALFMTVFAEMSLLAVYLSANVPAFLFCKDWDACSCNTSPGKKFAMFADACK